MSKTIASICFIFFLPLILFAGTALDTIPRVPGWAKDAVWYQIFPERFRNGDTGNDPNQEDIKGAWPYFVPGDWQIHPWTSDWYKLQPWESGIDWHRHFDWAEAGQPNFYASAGLRRYGGDLQGVLDRLDYLAELGINAIYFNPLFESPSLHKYDAAMYHHIDNNFGPNPLRDRLIWAKENPDDPATWQWTTADSLFLHLLKECHTRGIKVIIDGVFNHVGYYFWAFQDVLKNQQKSEYKDWFIIKSWDDPTTLKNEFEYEGWYGVRDLPEIREDDRGLVEGPREHIHNIVKRWMDPNGDGDPSDGIDGWRLDVADMVKMDFWRDFRKWVKEINPQAYITGEIWWEDWPRNKMFNAAPWLQGDAFDAVMNYRWGRAVKQFVIDRKKKISPAAFVDSLNAVFNDYPEENVFVLQNLIDSHDMERLASRIVNPDGWPDHESNPSQNPDFDVRKPNREEREIQKLVVGIQMTTPGAPLIYYGDEAGMWGGDDPDCRKPMVWPELKYEDEVSHPFGKPRPRDKVFFDNKLFHWYKQVIGIRRNSEVLSRGTIEYFLIDNSRNVLGYKRTYEGKSIYIILNSSDQPVAVELKLSAVSLYNLVSGETIRSENGLQKITLKPHGIKILE